MRKIQCPIISNPVDSPVATGKLPETLQHQEANGMLSVPVPEARLRVQRGKISNRVSERVLCRIAQAEAREPDPWIRDDYRVAWLTVLRASEGCPDPFGLAFWGYYGTSWQRAVKFWQERTAVRDKLLGAGLDSFAAANQRHVTLRTGLKRSAATPTAGGNRGAAPLTLAVVHPIAASPEAVQPSPMVAASGSRKPAHSVRLAEKARAK